MSAEDDIKYTLTQLIMSSQAQIIEASDASQSVSGEAENNLRASLFAFFSASNSPAGIVSPFPATTLMCCPSVPESISVFKYGSGDDDDIAGKDANDIETGMFVKSCPPIKGYILLIFSVGDLFKKCMRYTLMKSKVVDFQTQNQREHLSNLISLTEDEFEFFGDDFLHNAAIAMHNIIGSYGRNVGVRSMVFDLGTVNSPGTIIYALKVPEKGFLHNYVLQLYENVASALYYSVLQQWAQWCNDAGEVQANGAKYAVCSEAIMSFRNIGGPQTIRPTRYF